MNTYSNTLQKQLESASKDERYLQRLSHASVEQAVDGILWVDSTAHFYRANKAICRMLGYSRDELLELTIPDINPSYRDGDIPMLLEKAQDGITSFEANFRKKDGQIFPVELTISFIEELEGKSYHCTFVRDISERKKTEKELESQSIALTAIFNSTPSILILINEEGRVEKINHSRIRFSGKDENDLLGRLGGDVFNCVTSFDGEGCGQNSVCTECPLRCRVESTFHTGMLHYEEEGEMTFLHNDNEVHCYFLISTNLVKIEGSRKVLLSLTDITNIKQKEEALKRQQRTISLNNCIANTFLISPKEKIFHHTLETILEPLESKCGYFGYINEEGELICPSLTKTIGNQQVSNAIVFASTTWEGVWGRSLMEKRSLISNEKFQLPKVDVCLNSAIAVPIVHGDSLIGQFVVADKPGGYDKSDCELLESAAAQTAPILNALLEEEQQKKQHHKLEQQYLQAQKLESVGHLAGGVAHDLNNLLSPILGYGEMLIQDIAPEDPRRKSAEQIVLAGKRARDLIRQLLAFSRKQTLEFKNVCLNNLLTNFETLLHRMIREDIEMKFALSKSLPETRADVRQIEQVVMNLAINAQDAMPDGGNLTITTAPAELDEYYASQHKGVFPGCYVMLAISDTGDGMDVEVCNQIFEPFFTTKETGTGLGLATVYGIIKQHGGNIYVYSEPGQGTTFKIYLPAVEGSFEQQIKQRVKAQKLSTGTETILLVEDNRQVRELAYTILSRKGYNVLTASNGGEAISILSVFSDPVHLLLTDVVMPKMNGRQLYERVANQYPDIKVIYMSGYIHNVISYHGILQGGIAFVQKPFTLQTLVTKVRDVLDQ